MAVKIAEFGDPFVLDVDPEPGQTVGGVLEQEEVEVPENFTVLKNMEKANLTDPVVDNDVLLVIPPVEGGC